VTVTKSVDRTDALPNEILTYTLEPSWTGAALLEDVLVTDDLPDGTSYVNDSANAGGHKGGGTVRWNLGSNDPARDWLRLAEFSDLDDGINPHANVTNSYGGNDSDRPGVAVMDGSNVAHVVFRGASASANKDNIYYTNNSGPGGAWIAPALVSDDTDGNDAMQPSVAIDPSGTLHVIYSDKGSGDNQLNAYYNRIAGGVPGVPVRLSSDAEINVSETRIAVGPGGIVHTLFIDRRSSDEENNLYYRRSPDGGGSFEAPLRLSDDSDEAPAEMPTLAVAPDGTVHVVFSDTTGGELGLIHLSGDGTTFGARTGISDDSGNKDATQGDVAVDSAGVAHAVWTDDQAGDGSRNVYYANSLDWNGTRIRLNDDAASAINSIDPAITIDGQDRVHVAWIDRHDGDAKANVYYTNTRLGYFAPAVSVSAGLHADHAALPKLTARNGRLHLVYESKNASKRDIFHASADITDASPALLATLTAGPTLLRDGQAFNVDLTLLSSAAVDGVTPDALPATIVQSGMVATRQSTPATQDVPALAPVTFSSSYLLETDGGTGIDAFVFSAGAGNGNTTWGVADSNSVIAAPPLTFQVTVDDPPGVAEVTNVATIEAATPAFPMTNSNTVTTLLHLPGVVAGTVREDTNDDGSPDGPLGGATLALCDDLGAPVDNPFLPGTQPYTLTSDPGDGSYSFLVHAGTYQVREVDPSGYVSISDTDGLNDNRIGFETPLVVAYGGFSGGHDFLDSNSGTNEIEGNVYYDEFGLGGGFGDDPPMPGVIVNLYLDLNANGFPDEGLPPALTTVTDADGAYSFVNIPNFNVVIEEVDPAGAASTNDAGGLPFDSVVALPLGGDEIWSGVDFWDTNVSFSEIAGRVLRDADGSGTITPGDAPYGGVTVELFRDLNGNGALDAGEPLVATTVTGGQGTYAFAGLTNGAYLVVETDPPAATSLTDADGLANGPNTVAVTLAGAGSYGNDFLDDSGGISGQVRHDEDGDGDLADADHGVAGVRVELWLDVDNSRDLTGLDTFITHDITKAGGGYAFFGLANDRYIVVEVDPPGAVSTNDANDYPLAAQGTDNSIDVHVKQGAVQTGQDFLDTNVTEAGVTGRVRDDADGDGNLGDEDAGIAGALVLLATDPDADGDPADGAVIARTHTGSTGAFAFAHLAPGSYVVMETDPPGASSTNDADNDPFGPQGTDNRVAVTLSGSDLPGIDFLDSGAVMSGISGQVFDDDDLTDDGVIGPGDGPVGAVEIALHRDGNGNGLVDPGEPLLGTVLTAADGSYRFANVVPGPYVLTETDPAGAVSDFDTSGDPLDNMIGIALAGADSTSNDFLDDGITTRSVRGAVTDGQAGITGVRITLVSASGQFIDAVYSGADGAYGFANLAGGHFVVIETNPAGTTGGSDTDGGDPDRTAVDTTAGDAAGIDFIDLGVTLATISGRVLDDAPANNNAIDSNDLPLGGVELRLVLDADGNGVGAPGEPLVAVTLTRTDGYYAFPNLPEGSYAVVEINAPFS
ncbi:MAG: DUF11 domain-containing protein, partial [Akkermansiaceae bacterium]|nr:DUF11 domain-containing protein [Akkermansiaceae bacterium]